jgi:hypothetical protein
MLTPVTKTSGGSISPVTSASLSSLGVTGGSTTTPLGCAEVELITTLVAANLIKITPNISRIEDLAGIGLDFVEDTPIFEIELPYGGVVVRDLQLPSANVLTVEVSFFPLSGGLPKQIRGSPTSLPKSDFPSEKLRKIIIKVLNTNDNQCPRRVKLSVIVCNETPSTTARVTSE